MFRIGSQPSPTPVTQTSSSTGAQGGSGPANQLQSLMAALERAIAELSKQQGGSHPGGGDSLDLGNQKPGMNLQPKSGPAVGTIGTVGGKSAHAHGPGEGAPVFNPFPTKPTAPAQGPVFTPIHQLPVGGFPPIGRNPVHGPEGGNGPIGKLPEHPDHPEHPDVPCAAEAGGVIQRSIAVGTSGN